MRIYVIDKFPVWKVMTLCLLGDVGLKGALYGVT